MGKWYLVRHGVTEWNTQGRVQGHSDMPMAKAGFAQAQRLARRLQGVAFACACSSDLLRCRATAEAILKGRPLALDATPALREVAYGAWEGLTYQDVRDRFPAEYAVWMRGSLDLAAPGGESAAQVLQRLEAFRDKVLEGQRPQDDLLIVGHSGSLSALAVVLMRLPSESIWRFRLAPASLSILTLHSRTATLELWNDTSHLEGLDAA